MLLVPHGRIQEVRQRVERAERAKLRAPSVTWLRPAGEASRA
jgi:hypothetical protein